MSNQGNEFPLEKKNFMLIGIGSLIVVIGFFLMSGGGADDISSFSEDVFSFRRMYIAPLAILAGYGLVMYGIIKK
ncbi:MAG: DUF3098 domain-containing protein [Flavobacteriales bacterium]